MKDFRPNEMPIIFVPVMESRDPKELSKSSNKNYKMNLYVQITPIIQTII